MENPKKLVMLPLFFVVLLDMIGIGIIIPIIAPLMLDPSNGVLPVSYAAGTRNLILGMLMAVFPIFQFFGAPLLGAFSDRHGRKKLLMASIFGTFLGYAFFGLGILMRNVYLLFLGRIIAGFTGGNISIAFSSVADISNEKSKAKNFGILGMAFGFGFIIGPYIGGKLADPNFVSWFDFATPMWFAALLSLANILLIVMFFSETLGSSIRTKISLFTGFRNIAKALRLESLRTMFMVMFLHSLGFSFFTQFFQVFLIQKFSFSQVQIGSIFAYVGLWIAITQGIVTRIVARFMSPRKVVSMSIFALSVFLLMIIIPSKPSSMYFIMPLVALAQGLTFPNSTSIISNLGGKESQGEILGINQSIQSLALAISPLVAGIIVSFNMNLPIIMSSIITFMAWLVFFLLFREKKKEVFHEV